MSFLFLESGCRWQEYIQRSPADQISGEMYVNVPFFCHELKLVFPVSRKPAVDRISSLRVTWQSDHPTFAKVNQYRSIWMKFKNTRLYRESALYRICIEPCRHLQWGFWGTVFLIMYNESQSFTVQKSCQIRKSQFHQTIMTALIFCENVSIGVMYLGSPLLLVQRAQEDVNPGSRRFWWNVGENPPASRAYRWISFWS